MKKVLFVCLGNICRSPMAEYVFKEIVRKEGKDKNLQHQQKKLVQICIMEQKKF